MELKEGDTVVIMGPKAIEKMSRKYVGIEYSTCYNYGGVEQYCIFGLDMNDLFVIKAKGTLTVYNVRVMPNPTFDKVYFVGVAYWLPSTACAIYEEAT